MGRNDPYALYNKRVVTTLVTMEENVGHITAISSVTMESGQIIGKQVAV